LNAAIQLKQINIEYLEKENPFVSYNQEGMPVSKYKNNKWDFTNEKYVRQWKRSEYKINFDITFDNEENLLTQKNKKLLKTFKSFLLILLTEKTFRTVKGHFVHMKYFLKFLIKEGISSFENIDEKLILKYRENLFKEYGVGSNIAFRRLVTVMLLIEKRKFLPNCFKKKFFKDISASKISLIKDLKPKKQTEFISDQDIKSIIEKCNQTIGNANKVYLLKKEIIQLKKEHKKNKIKSPASIYVGRVLSKKYSDFVSLTQHNKEIKDIHTACFILVSVYTGMRIGEVISIPINCIKTLKTKSGNEDYEVNYIKSTTYKYEESAEGTKNTNDIRSEWLANGEVVKAVNIMKKIFKNEYKKETCPNNLFISNYYRDGQDFKIVKSSWISTTVKEYLGSEKYNHHRFRRTFARLVARSSFGEVDILKEHFKHKSREITEYYMNDSLDFEMYQMIEKEQKDISNSNIWREMLIKLIEKEGIEVVENRFGKEIVDNIVK
jgi:integrase